MTAAADTMREQATALIKRVKSLEGILARRKIEQAIRYYRPHPKQQAFHAAGLKYRIRCFLGANRVGKTTANIAEAVAHALGYRPWLPETHPEHKIEIRIPNRGLLISESFGEQVKKVLLTKLLGDPDLGTPGLLPKHMVDSTKKNQQGIITQVKITNGSIIGMNSYEQEPRLFEGDNPDWIGYDEPPPRAIWIATQRGLVDTNGPCWVTMTPLREAWFYDEVIGREDVWKTNASMTENVGYGLTQRAVDEFAKTLSDDEKEMRLHGRYFHLTGLVYSEYRADIHRISRFKLDPTYGLWMHIDPHPRKPHHAVWIAAHPDGRLFVCGELVNDHPSNLVSHMAQKILAYEKSVLEYDPRDVVRLIDPLSKTNDPKDGGTIWKEFAQHGVTCRVASKDREGGITRVKRLLTYNPDTGQFPSMFFFRDLQRVHYEMTHYMWQEWAGKNAESRDPREEPVKKNDDLVEGIYRIVLDNPEAPALGEYEREEEKPVFSSGLSVGY